MTTNYKYCNIYLDKMDYEKMIENTEHEGYFHLIAEAVTCGLGKSELTDEYCKKLIDLYKICMILSRINSCRDPKAYIDLFIVKYVELQKYAEQRKEAITHSDDSQLKLYQDKILSWCDDMVRYVEGDKGKSKPFVKMKETISNLSPVVLKAFIIHLFYERFKPNDFVKGFLPEMLSLIDEKQISTESLDIDAELKRLVDMGLFLNKPSPSKDNGMSSKIYEVERLGFMASSIGKVGSEVDQKIHDLTSDYWKGLSLDGGNSSKSL